MSGFDSNEFKRVLSSFPTGVVVVTATNDDGDAFAMTVGSFVSVSLDPPMVGFLPTKTSSSWAAIRDSGTRFGVNVLSETQEDVCRAVATRRVNKLDGFEWTLSDQGNPRLSGSIAFIDCDTASITDGGDHEIVLGRVIDLYTMQSRLPLLFYRGGYGSFRPGSMAVNAGISPRMLHELDLIRPHVERLAARLVTEVTVMSLVEWDLVTVASAGVRMKTGKAHRVGRHVPFMPPIGGVFAAFGGPEAEEMWMSRIYDDADSTARACFEQGLDAVRERGYAYGLGHGPGSAIELASASSYEAATPEERKRLVLAINDAAAHFNLEQIEPDQQYEFHSATAPVFDRDGTCVFSLTAWGIEGESSGADVLAVFNRLRDAADTCTQELKFSV